MEKLAGQPTIDFVLQKKKKKKKRNYKSFNRASEYILLVRASKGSVGGLEEGNGGD